MVRRRWPRGNASLMLSSLSAFIWLVVFYSVRDSAGKQHQPSLRGAASAAGLGTPRLWRVGLYSRTAAGVRLDMTRHGERVSY